MEADSRFSAGSRAAFRMQVQKTRAATYALAFSIGLVFRWLGALDISVSDAVLLVASALASAVVFTTLSVSGAAERMGPLYSALWLLTDTALISWAVYLTGGASSPFFPWFLANISGAAFVMGQLGGFAVAVADTLAYVTVLVHNGDITGFDLSLYEPLARMAFLYGASFLFLRGVSILKEKQQVIKAIRDDAKRKVEELTRLTAALDQGTRELEAANLRIREADRLKSQFLANMSHELRTPLNSIIGFSDVLLNRLPDDLPPRYHKFLRNIHSSGEHLLGIINDLLDLSKIEAGKMELCPEPVELALVAQGVCSIMHGSARSRNIRLQLELPPQLPPVEADPVKIRQILFNLVSNAVKFSDDGGTVHISASHSPGGSGGDGSVQLTVQDHGVGIAAEDHQLIFEEFRQVDGSSTRSFGGTGLGLALVKRLVELHGGTIHVDSAPGVGSTFQVSLPVRFTGSSETAVDEASQPVELASGTGPRILVVEDDPTAYELISSHLIEASYRPIRARTGDEALRLARRVEPAAITLDIILPGVDGWEVLKRLKHDPVTCAIPVIIVSVLDNPDLAVTLGAADYLSKPLQCDALVRRLAELIGDGEPAARPRLLLIDDDPELHELVEAKLASLGYTVEHALDGRQGLAAASRSQPELILLDLMMDEMDGFEVAARLKEGSETAHIPVVVLTAKEVDSGDHDRLRDRVAALVRKAEIPGDRLAAVIERVLSGGDHEST